MTFLDTLEPEERELVAKLRAEFPQPLRCAILWDGEVVPADMLTACFWQVRHPDDHLVGHDIVGGTEVSTVFMTVPMPLGGGRTGHFETMTFGGVRITVRYDDLASARDGHSKVLEGLRK